MHSTPNKSEYTLARTDSQLSTGQFPDFNYFWLYSTVSFLCNTEIAGKVLLGDEGRQLPRISLLPTQTCATRKVPAHVHICTAS